MAAQMLEAACHNVQADDQEAEPVVTALGSGGRYYICTRTRANEYKQHFHGLPKALEEWLFPADGSSRHFETLQVILIGDDGFWASDKDGELRSNAGRPSQRLKRPLTWHGQQRRAADSRRSQQGEPSEGAQPSRSLHGRSSSGEAVEHHEPTSPRAVPVAMALSRSRTSAVSGTWPRPLPDERRVEVLRREALKRRRSRLSVDEGALYPAHVMPPLPLAVVAAPRYADAGVQTDSPSSSATTSSTIASSTSSRSGSTSSSMTSSMTSTNTSSTITSTITSSPSSSKPPPAPAKSIPRSRHSRASSSSSGSSLYFAASDALVWHTHDAWPRKPSNPVAMGQLQEYFRSTSYTLGDALEPVAMG
ncbi:hypothetical protein CDD81_4982 [Ophiocordyceps australis]|uniref:Uncharacterized protein n=1 Tax=Ophiocordyceps australis TaxID=1399860 RepID=A0A2C5Y5Y6_9HYPO|nr:hypothetical protein CDD81_4982 [Ophiocordyceps australis]